MDNFSISKVANNPKEPHIFYFTLSQTYADKTFERLINVYMSPFHNCQIMTIGGFADAFVFTHLNYMDFNPSKKQKINFYKCLLAIRKSCYNKNILQIDINDRYTPVLKRYFKGSGAIIKTMSYTSTNSSKMTQYLINLKKLQEKYFK